VESTGAWPSRAAQLLALAASPSVLTLGLVCALLLWFSFPTLALLHTVWTQDANYSHGYVVLALSAFLGFRSIVRAPLAPMTPSYWGLACVVPLMLVVVAGHGSTTLQLASAPLPALWIAGLWAIAGAPLARRLWPALTYLYAVIPIWDGAIEPLRKLTVWVVSSWIRMSPVPAFIEGNEIHLSSGTIEVADGCAGLRYALVALALAGFMSLLHRRRLGSAVMLIASGLALGLLGNWVRVFGLVLVGHYSEMQSSLIVHGHASLGWVLFAVCMVPLFLWNWNVTPASEPAQDAGSAQVAVDSIRLSRPTPYASLALALVVGIALNYRVQGDAAPSAIPPLAQPQLRGWTRVGDWRDWQTPIFVGAMAEAAGWYVDGGEGARVGVYRADYPVQQQEHEVVFLENRPQGTWGTIVARTRTDVGADSGARLPFREIEVTDLATGRRLVWVGMRVAGSPVADDLRAKWLQLRGALSGRYDAQALVLVTACEDDCNRARMSLSRFAAAAAERLYDDVPIR
jgi:EpsI family protein